MHDRRIGGWRAGVAAASEAVLLCDVEVQAQAHLSTSARGHSFGKERPYSFAKPFLCGMRHLSRLDFLRYHL